MIRERLLRLLPGSLFMGEEESPDAAAGEWRWIVDPLDGTLNYIQGLPVYAVSIALEHNRDEEASFGEIVAGVIYLPYLKTLYEAVAGEEHAGMDSSFMYVTRKNQSCGTGNRVPVQES